MADGGFDYGSIPAGYYDAVFDSRAGMQSKWHHLKFDRIRDAIAGRIDHLDIGCGPGTFIGTLGLTHRSTGIDLSAEQIAFARARHGGDGHRFETVAAGPLPYADASFDAVTIIELVEHLTGDEGAVILAEAMRVLRPKGRLVVSTPNYKSAWPMVEWLLNRLGAVSYADQHITHYGRASLRALMERAGARAVAVEGYMLAAPFTAALDWRLADGVAAIEPGWIVDRFGLLLLAVGEK